MKLLYKLFPFLTPKFAGFKVGDEAFLLNQDNMLVTITGFRKCKDFPIIVRTKFGHEWVCNKSSVKKLTKLDKALR